MSADEELGPEWQDLYTAEQVRQLLWFVGALARARKTGALRALAEDLAGPIAGRRTWTRGEVKGTFANLKDGAGG